MFRGKLSSLNFFTILNSPKATIALNNLTGYTGFVSKPCKIHYYVSASGENPVKNFIESLSDKQARKVARVLSYIENYGLVVAISHVKKLAGTPLWEIRILGQDNIRVLYASVLSGSIVLIHGFVKKSQQTPGREIKTALERLNDWLAYQKDIDR